MIRRDLARVSDLLPLAAAFPSRYPCLLESAARGSARARFDILFACPEDVLEKSRDGRVRDLRGVDRGGSFLDALEDEWQTQRRDADADRDEMPFHGGWVVFLAYEIAGEVEATLAMPSSAHRAPIALALRCPAAIIVDHQNGTTTCVAEPGYEMQVDSILQDLDVARSGVTHELSSVQVDEDDEQSFLDGVEAIHEHLRSGEVFQVNLSRGWRARFATAPPPASLYAALRRANPAPFAGLLQWQDWAVASSSPERLVEIRGNLAQTRPIAGTRPRVVGDDDEVRIRELVGHVKERAEHVMLIDLERNDLGRICVPGSVTVDELMTVESYAHVHHIVSNVRGRVRAGITPSQVIRAVFPGGTITGAPKVRTMQIISALERHARGAYTGALGYLDRSGDMDLNILIRTFEQQHDVVRFRAGAGIVADSVAAHELAETRAKARGMLIALGCGD